jgi:malonyl-CoA O-methyltransferase
MADRVAAAAAERRAPERILELGCGTGYLTGLLRDAFRHARITAVDLAENMIELARRRVGRLSQIEFVVADVETVEWPRETFDLIVSSATLQWLAAPDRTLSRLAEALRPGGRMLHATFGPATFEELHAVYHELEEELGFATERHGLELATGEEWLALLRASGLEAVGARNDWHRAEYASCRSFLEAVKRTGASYSPSAGAATSVRLPVEAMRRYDSRFRVAGGVYATFHALELTAVRPRRVPEARR